MTEPGDPPAPRPRPTPGPRRAAARRPADSAPGPAPTSAARSAERSAAPGAGPTLDAATGPAAGPRTDPAVVAAAAVAPGVGAARTTTTLGAGPVSRRLGDRIFGSAASVAGMAVLVLVVAIGVFLVTKALPALRADKANFLTEKQWLPDNDPVTFGIAAAAFGTLVCSVLALLVAGPLAIGVALYISEYARPRLARPIGYVVDLLAAVPSVVYGLWGLNFLVPHTAKLQLWLSHYLGWIPLFRLPAGAIVGRSLFIASIVLAIMIVPIIAAISREVFLQVPAGQREAALALGATRLETIRTAVLPASRSGIVGALMLGLGRALGETIAVALVLSITPTISIHVLNAVGGNTIAANIAAQYQGAETIGRGALIASGLVLFAITFVVNGAARAVVARGARRVAG